MDTIETLSVRGNPIDTEWCQEHIYKQFKFQEIDNKAVDKIHIYSVSTKTDTLQKIEN